MLEPHRAHGSKGHACRSIVSHLNASSRTARHGFDPTQGIAILEQTPAALREELRGLDSAWIDATEGPDTWSPYVILGHMISI